jgi:phosphonopyruvate decarboxylase
VTLACEAIYGALAARGVTFYAGVPDSLLKSFCAYVTDHAGAGRHVITANEGSAVALVAGHYLATGELGVVYLQNSGLGNMVNPLTSLADPDVYGLPMLLLVGWRGEPGVKDEPQHAKMGKVTAEALTAIGVANAVLPAGDEAAAIAAIDVAIETARARSAPYALIVGKDTFGEYKLKTKRTAPYAMTREEAIGVVIGAIPAGTAVVSTTGMPSRELFELRKARGEGHDGDFLTVGSMGHSSQIALGVALARPDRDVLCLDGDGAVLMHMGGLATIGSLAPARFKHVVLNNGAHDSVGGQPTVAFDIDLCAVARACGYRVVLRAESADELRARVTELAAAEGPALLEVRVAKGNRADLGRPTVTPQDTKRRFMKFLAG